MSGQFACVSDRPGQPVKTIGRGCRAVGRVTLVVFPAFFVQPGREIWYKLCVGSSLQGDPLEQWTRDFAEGRNAASLDPSFTRRAKCGFSWIVLVDGFKFRLWICISVSEPSLDLVQTFAICAKLFGVGERFGQLIALHVDRGG